MPGLPDRMFHSYNIGPVHFISFNTEVYYFLNYGLKNLILQYMWLAKDLQVMQITDTFIESEFIFVV